MFSKGQGSGENIFWVLHLQKIIEFLSEFMYQVDPLK